MAQIKTVELIDDLDESTAAETVEFALSGRSYEIDLSEANALKLRDALKPFVAAGRRVSGTGRARQPGTRRALTTVDREQNAAIRSWAKARGMKIAERGRIPADVLEEYHGSGKASVG